MSKYDLLKAVAKKKSDSSKQTQQNTSGSFTSSSNSKSGKSTSGNIAASSNKTSRNTSGSYKSSSNTSGKIPTNATYWQAEQQNRNQSQTQKAKQQISLNTKQEKKRTAIKTEPKIDKYRAQRESRYQNLKRKVEEKERNKAANVDNTYAQASAILRGEDPRKVSNWQVRQEQEKAKAQAEIAQSNIDKARKQIDSNAVTKAVSDTGLATLGGLTSGIGGQFRAASNIAQGIGGLIGDKDLINAGRKFDQELGIEQAVENVRKNNMVSNNMVGQVAESIGGMLPTIAGNVMSGGSEAIGLGLMGLSSFGNEGSNAFNRLASDGELSQQDAYRALMTGAAKAGLEVGTEQLSSLFPGLDTFAWTNPDHILGQMGVEALEEMVSTALEPLIDPWSDPNMQNGLDYGRQVYENTFGNPLEYAKDIGYSGLLGGATSAVMGGANIANTTNNQIARDIRDTAQDFNVDQSTTTPGTERLEQARTENDVPNPGIDPEYPAARDVEVTQEVQPEPQVNPEDYQAVASDEDTITDGIYTPEAEIAQDTANQLNGVEATPEVTETTQATETTTPEQTEQEIIAEDKEVKTVVPEAVTSENPEQITKAKDNLTTTIGEQLNDHDSAEVKQMSDSIVEQVNYAHQIETRVPLQEAETGRLKQSKGKNTTIKELRSMGGEEYASELKSDQARGNYRTISRESALRSAQAVYDDVGLDGMRDIILNPEYMDNKSVSGTMIDYCRKYEEESIKARNAYMKDKGLSYKKGKWYQGGNEVDSSAKVVRDLIDMDWQNKKVVDAYMGYKSNAGYALQACRLMNNISPEVKLASIEQWINKTNKEMHRYDSGRRNASIDNLTEAERQAYLNAETEEERAKIIKQIEERVAGQIPAGVSEMASQWRYLMMLANPATHIRNIVGNALQQCLTNAKNATTYMVEKAFYQGRRFTSHLDMDVTGDVDISNYAKTVPFDMLESEFQEYMKNGINDKGKSERRAYWKSKGYSGQTLEYLAKGKNQAVSGLTQQRWGYSLANMIKDGGYTVNDQGALVDSAGNVVDDATIKDLMQKGFEDSKKHYVDSSQFSRVNDEGKAVYLNKFSESDNKLVKYSEDFFKKYVDKDAIDQGKWKANGITKNMKVFENTKSEIFNKTIGKAIDTAAGWNDTALDVEDKLFTTKRFAAEFATHLKMNGYTIEDGKLMKGGKEVDIESREILRMQQYAYEEALESVYRDVNHLARAISNYRAKNKVGQFLIDATIPFTTTPFNITKRVCEYSVPGLVKGLYGTMYAVEAGKMSAQTAINSLARGATGSALIALGAILAKYGFLKGKDDEENTRVGKFKSSLGGADYAFTIPGSGVSYTLDWASPSGAIMLLGATAFDKLTAMNVDFGQDPIHAADDAFNWALESLTTTFDPVIDMTVLSSLQDVLENYQYGKSQGIVKGVVKNYVGQYSPTLGAKFNKILDDTTRTTYSDTWLGGIVRQNMQKMPLLSTILKYKNEPALDYSGEDVSNRIFGNKVADAAYYLFSPGNVKIDKTTDYEKELLKLSQETGNTYIIPTQFSYLEDKQGTKYQFTPEERTELNRYYLQTYKEEVQKFMDSDTYSLYDGDEGIKAKADIIDKIQKHVFNMTKYKYFSRVLPDASDMLYSSDKAAEKMKKIGLDYYEYYQLQDIEGLKDSEGNSYSNSGAIQVRNYLEKHGVYHDVVKAIKIGDIKLADVGLTKTVIEADAEQYDKAYQAFESEEYNLIYTILKGQVVEKKKKNDKKKKKQKQDQLEQAQKLFSQIMSQNKP